MESTLSKALTITAMTGFLIVGSAAAAILSRDDLPALGAAMFAPTAAPQPVLSNWESKSDRLAVAEVIPVALDTTRSITTAPEPLRQAFASASASDTPAVKAVETATAKAAEKSVEAAAAPAKPKVAAKPPAQKTYSLLSEAQIAGVKERLRLSESQEYYWPAVENALRAVARKLHATRQTDPGTAAALDPDSAEVQQLKAAAMPLLFQLREDQKREVRSLARLIGLEKVASMI